MAPARSTAARLLPWPARRAKPDPEHLALGAWGEKQAEHFLRRQRFRILYRNFRAPGGGEVDLVCRDKPEAALVFVEVKTRTHEEHGRPADAVDHAKQRLIARGAMAWLRLLNFPDIRFRFDIVEVVGARDDAPVITHIRNAFPLPDDYVY